MKTTIKMISLFFLAQSIFAGTTSPIGDWKTIDDVTGRAKAIVRIQESSNKELYGKVIKVFPQPDPVEFCTACKGERHNKPVLGMAILENLKKDQQTANMWSNGQILDPRSGKIYHCNVQVIEGGKKLAVRGYMGIPLFGRSQTWIRMQG